MGPGDELYNRLLASAPYGTLFLFHNTCLECSPSAERLLDVRRDQLIGSALDHIRGDESAAWLDLKLLLKRAVATGARRLTGRVRTASGEVPLDIILSRAEGDEKGLLVTLMPDESLQSAAPASIPDQPLFTSFPSFTTPVSATSAEPEATPSLHRTQAPESLAAAGWAANNPTAEVVAMFAHPAGGAAEPDGRDRQQVYRDGLTGLPNRQFLVDSLGGYLSQHRGDAACAALLMIDLDHFKDINDSWGHAVGDQVIRKIGGAIVRNVAPGHLLARLSGDEFMLFIPQVSGGLSRAAWEAKEQAERIREIVAAPVFHDGHELALTASIGIALIVDNQITAERALQYADSAMYEAKRKGRNGIAFFDPCITEKAKRQVGLNTRLRKAIDNQEFALHIQPQLSVATGELLGGEALLRWVSSEHDCCAPAEFIPVLESSGLIVNVGHWVIRTACEYIRNYLDAGLWKDHMRLGINISPRQFLDPQLFDVVSHSLSSYRVDPKYLNFEITENLLIQDIDDVIRKMKRIKSLGSLFSIDDFGIGYSSMIYLKRLPFDHLKIDREFIRNIHRDAESLGVVEAMMAVSRQYGLRVTAEGVEHPDSLEVLRKVGCDSYQGAHYSMPVSPERFRAMLSAA